MVGKEKPKTARNFRNYKVWQDAVAYATEIYKVTNEMPWFEKKGLCDQLQRAAVSISSNIAEGAAKPSDTEGLKQFLCSLNADSVGELQEKGKISRKLAEEKYSKEVILQKFVEVV